MGVGMSGGIGMGMVVGVGLSMSCDVDLKDRSNRASAVLYAAEGGHLECVKILARYGADMESKDRQHETVLHKAARSGGAGVVQWLCEYRGSG
jgi:ankyrin repeat protein